MSTPIRRDSGESYCSTSDSNIDNDKTDWTLCFLYQKQISEKIQCSALSKTDPKKLYGELADRIKEFYSIKMLPIPLNIVKLEDGLDLEQSLFKNSAKFHKSCKLKFASAKLEKTHKKASSNTAETKSEISREETSVGITCWFNYHYKADIGFHLSCVLWLTYYHNIFDKRKTVVINWTMLKDCQYFSFSEIAPNIFKSNQKFLLFFCSLVCQLWCM